MSFGNVILFFTLHCVQTAVNTPSHSNFYQTTITMLRKTLPNPTQKVEKRTLVRFAKPFLQGILVAAASLAGLGSAEAQQWDPSGAGSGDPIHRKAPIGIYNTQPLADIDLGEKTYNNELNIRFNSFKDNKQLIKFDYEDENFFSIGVLNSTKFALFNNSIHLLSFEANKAGFFTSSPVAKFHLNFEQGNEAYFGSENGISKGLIFSPDNYFSQNPSISAVQDYTYTGQNYGGTYTNTRLSLNPKGGGVAIGTNTGTGDLYVNGSPSGGVSLHLNDGATNSNSRILLQGSNNDLMIFGNDGIPAAPAATTKNFTFISKWDLNRTMNTTLSIFGNTNSGSPTGLTSPLTFGNFGTYTSIYSGTQLYLHTAPNQGIIVGADPVNNPQNILANGYTMVVNGKLGAKEIWCSNPSNSVWPDYVFEPTYALPSLADVEKFIIANKHLPAVPSAKEVEKNGISLGEMDATLLKKVEELTLYLIELKKQNETLAAEVAELKTTIKK